MSSLIEEYILMRVEQVCGEEKLHRHDCCRRELTNELLDILNLIKKDGVSVEEEPGVVPV